MKEGGEREREGEEGEERREERREERGEEENSYHFLTILFSLQWIG